MGTLDDLVGVVDAAEGFLDDPRSYLGAQRVLQVAVESLSSTQAESLLPWARESLVRISKKALGSATLQPVVDVALLTVEALSRRVVQARVKGVDDPTRHILSEYATPAVPDLALLKEFLVSKPAGLCFPLSPARYATLKSHDLAGMFGKGTPNSYCVDLENLLALSVIKPPGVGITEFSYIPFWNMLIHEAIKGYLQTSVPFTFDRNTNCETQTLSQLPDYVGYVGALYSLFRGEEKVVRGPGNPKKELMNKLVWVYKDVPYLLGYHARGPNVTFGALYHGGGKVQCEDLVTVDLSSMTGRVRSQLILFNLGRVLAGLCDLCSKRNEISDTFTVQEVDSEKGGKSVVLSGYSVIKGYMDLEKAKKVWNTYSRIQGCPNAEKCHTRTCPRKRKRNGDPDEDDRLYTLTFTPRLDTNQQARPVPELLKALLHVSSALCYAHERGVIHRDVSWRNVGLELTSNQWVLFDWDESCTSPAPCAAVTLSGACHAPEISLGPHDTAVDVWGLGWLIHTSKVTLTQELEELRDDCLEEQPKARPTMTSCTDRLQKMFANLDG
ncbi:uncharacterized protein LOC9648867 [Selaginella moellendorffii]|nr:uncharacterized protein LOC9648867 [Selaginella moellendorffii]|eukprot:XP_002976437.2 uncharacterized protein LOC9648867 [Selaginella moellendorffii]